MNREIRNLARRLAALEKARLNAKQPTLGNSSIDGGALQVADDNDTLTMIVGTQFDGTNTAAVVVGPTPPKPTMPLATPTFNGIRVYWDGTFVGGEVAPMDFSRVTIHATTDGNPANFNPLDQAKVVGEINTATGGEVFASLVVGVQRFIWLVCWSQSGSHSSVSDPDFATPGAITSTEIADGSITTPKLDANAVTASKIAATAIDGKTITGAIVQTAPSGKRMIMKSDGAAGVLEFHTGDPLQPAAAYGVMNPDVFGSGGTSRGVISLKTPSMGSGVTELFMRSPSNDGSIVGEIVLNRRLHIEANGGESGNLIVDGEIDCDVFTGIKSGVRTISVSGSDVVITASVVFTNPVPGSYPVPAITLTTQGGDPRNWAAPTVSSPTRNGFDINIVRLSGSAASVDVHWHALAC